MSSYNSLSKWYVVRVFPNYEKIVSEKLLKEFEKKISSNNPNKYVKVYVPTQKSIVKRKNKSVVIEKPIYPNYVFVETNSVEDIISLLKELNGNMGLLRNSDGVFQVLNKQDIDKILKQIEDENNKYITKILVGDRVKILEGPFAGFCGIVENIKDNMVKIPVYIFGKKNIIEISIEQIEKIEK